MFSTGGAGYIGSHTIISLVEAGYDVLVADNFCNSSKKIFSRLKEITNKDIPWVEVDFTDFEATDNLFSTHSIKGVIHFAALKAVGESVTMPLMYYENNMNSLLNVLKAMQKHEVYNFVFSSSATVYKDCPTKALTEEDALGPSNPYGQTKYMAEQICQDLARANPKFRMSLLRYFNPAGNHPSGLIGESPQQPNNLLPFVQQVAVGRRPELVIYGNDWDTRDGTGIRDYLHVMDLADGHVAAMKLLLTMDMQKKSGCSVFNLGGGVGTTVLEMVKFFEKASGRKIPCRIGERRQGDLAVVIANPSKANNELQWKATRTVETACEDAWKWQSNNPQGFE